MHTQNAPPFDVLLGQFGRSVCADNDLLADDPGFRALYLQNERVQRQLGRPISPAEPQSGAFQAFEFTP